MSKLSKSAKANQANKIKQQSINNNVFKKPQTVSKIFSEFLKDHPEVVLKPEWERIIYIYGSESIKYFCENFSYKLGEDFIRIFKDILVWEELDHFKMSDDFLIEMYDYLKWTKSTTRITGKFIIDALMSMGGSSQTLTWSDKQFHYPCALCGDFSIAFYKQYGHLLNRKFLLANKFLNKECKEYILQNDLENK